MVMLKKYFTKAFLMYITFNHQSVNLLAKCSCCCENNKEKSDSSPQKQINPGKPINPKGPKNPMNPFFTTSTDPLVTPTTTTTTAKEPIPNPEEKEKEELIKRITNLIDEKLKSLTELEKKLEKYMWCKNVNDTDENLRKGMIDKCDFQSKGKEDLEVLLQDIENHFANGGIRDAFKNSEIKSFDFKLCIDGYIYSEISGEDEEYRKRHFRKGYWKTPAEYADKFKCVCVDLNEGKRKDYYCIFNESVYKKLTEQFANKSCRFNGSNEDKSDEDKLYFLATTVLGDDTGTMLNSEAYRRDLKYDIDDNTLELTIFIPSQT